MNTNRQISKAIQFAPRCTLFNTHTGEWMDCLLNPTQLAEKIQVNYSRITVPGLANQILQYQSTANRQIPGVEFYLDKYFANEQSKSTDILAFRRFLLALTVPPRGGQAPPVAQIIWPCFFSVDVVLNSVEFRYQKFSVSGDVLIYTANCSFEEIVGYQVIFE